jgi:hypothetical protein
MLTGEELSLYNKRWLIRHLQEQTVSGNYNVRPNKFLSVPSNLMGTPKHEMSLDILSCPVVPTALYSLVITNCVTWLV